MKNQYLRHLGKYWHLLLLICLSLSACSERQDKTFRIAFNTWVGYGPFYIAQDRGFFSDAGLEVELLRMEGTGERRAALIAGRIEALGSTIDDFVVGLSQGLDAKMILVLDESFGADGIVASRQITRLEDLAGKRIAVQPGFVNHFFLLYILDRHGIAPDGFELIPMEPDKAATALLGGDVDAAVTWEPHLSLLRKQPEYNVLLTTRDPEAQHLILDNLIVSTDILESRGLEVGVLVDAWFKAVEFMRTEPASAATILSQAFELPPEEVLEIMGGVTFPTRAETKALFDKHSAQNVFTTGGRATALYQRAGVIPPGSVTPSFEEAIDPGFVAVQR